MKHFISSLSVLCANTPPCKGRVSSRKILSLLLILFLSIGNVWGAEEELYKTVLFGSSYNSKGVSGYDNVEFTSTNEDFTVVVKNANNNGNQWNVIKIGGKNGAYTGTITTQESINRLITKVDLTIDGITSSSVTSIELYSSSNGTNWTKVGDFNKAQGISSVEISSPTTDLYYQLKAVCTQGSSNGLITISKVEFYAEKDASAPTLSSIAISGDLTNKTYEEGQELDLTGLTVTGTYSDASTQDVTADVEWSYNPLTQGQTSVTVTATYEEQTADITITGLIVNEHVVTPGEYDINLTNTFFNHTLKANISGEVSGHQNDITVKIAGTGITKPRTDETYVRFYASSSMTVSVPDGYVITSIAITKNESDYAAPTANVGSFNTDTKTWTGNAQSVVLSFSAKSFINTIKVTYAADVKYTLNITTPANGTLVVKEGETELANGAQVSSGTSLTVIPTPAEGYLFESLTIGSENVTLTDGKYTFTMPESDVTVAATFKLNEKPAATLTLSKNGVTEDITGYKQDDKVTLPSITSDCVKEFVGWSANPTCNVAPEYAAGDSYTLASTSQTLYAVYADGEAGEPTWNRVTNLAALTSGGTFILGYEATPKSGTIIPMRTSGTATTSAAGYMYSGNADGTTSNNATLDMASISESSKFEIVLEASSIVDGAVNIKLGDNYLGNTDTKNNCKLFTSASKNTAFTPTIGTNDVVKLTIKANEEYTTLQFNNNSGSYRYAVYGGAQKDVVFYKKEITSSYSNYSTTCAAAPKAEVNPTSVTATAAGANDKVEVTYENVNTESVAVALFNDEACTDAFSADWLTASLDADKNITYTVAATTLYTERKAYIKLTAPETTGATEPAVVVIPVTQAAKDKVFASLEALLAAITPTTEGVEVTVTLTNEVIQDFYTSGSYTNGIALNVPYEGGVKVIEIYCKDVPAEWVKGGKVSGTITCPWKLYNSPWELCPTAWTELTYTAPATVKSIAVSGTPTKTTYVDGEAFDPTGLVVTATLTDDSTEPIDVALVDWAFNPATLTKGETAVSVTATYNSVSSAAYEVTGLTVNDIPTKTVAEFIAAGGTRCYLEGIVSGLTEGNSMKYGNFDLTDASGTIYVYGCLNAAGESEKFADLGVKNGDKIKVIADEYELYNGTTEEAKNVQYVSHISAATITIADITMEVEEVKTISATVEPAEAVVTYTIKENAANAISLSGNVITALAEGTATITATVAEGATYLGNSVDFTVTVGPKTEKTNVVILAQYNGDWYALVAAKGSANNTLGAVEVTYVNGVILDFDGDKASITWERAVVGNKATFKNGTNYMKGATGDTDLTLETSAFEWDVVDGKYLSDSNKRTFLFQGSYFKNYAISNAGKTTNGTTYSAMPVVTAVEFMNSVTTPSVEKGIFSVGNGEFVQFSTGNLQYEVGTNTWSFASEQYEVIGGEAYTGSNNTNYGMNEPGYTGKLDLFAWSCDGKFGVNPSNADADYTGEFADWGNLVNETGWYTLTKDEMTYILNRKKDGKKLWALATVCGMNGLILLPDNWNTSTTLEYGYIPADWNYTKNQLDAAAWATLEAAGAVFLPEGGTRVGGHGNKDQGGGPAEFDAHGDYFHVDNVGEMGYYWLNSTTSEKADYLILPGWSDNGTPTDESDDKALAPQVWSREKRRGNSVRLVKEVTPDYERDVRQGYYGTICLENGGQMIGASLFGLSYYNEAQGLLYMDEVGTTTMTAGNPYIFLPNERATNNTLYVFYDETTAAAKTVNGLVGYLGDENMQLEGNGTNYILQDNKIKKVVGGNNSNVFVTKNRAYIQLGNVNPNEPAPIPGRRRVAIGQAPQVATGMENVDASAQPVKTIINGQLFILRGEKMYDAQGKLVK